MPGAASGPSCPFAEGRGVRFAVSKINLVPQNAANRRGRGDASRPHRRLTGHDPGSGVA